MTVAASLRAAKVDGGGSRSTNACARKMAAVERCSANGVDREVTKAKKQFCTVMTITLTEKKF